MTASLRSQVRSGVRHPSTEDRITMLHTLGPAGTNCERAARKWFTDRGMDPRVTLHATLEDALADMPRATGHALMACIAYRGLDGIFFNNLSWLSLHSVSVELTNEMVLAGRGGGDVRTIASHSAPSYLVPTGTRWVDSRSNAQAAADCRGGLADACITTSTAAHACSLTVLKSYGRLRMGFSIHVPHEEIS